MLIKFEHLFRVQLLCTKQNKEIKRKYLKQFVSPSIKGFMNILKEVRGKSDEQEWGEPNKKNKGLGLCTLL